jgi:hypothetical protein
MQRSFIRLLRVGGLAAVVGCSGDPVRPSAAIGQYTLERADGAALPVVLRATVYCDEIVTDGTLSIDSLYAFEFRLGMTQDCSRAGGLSTHVGIASAGTVAQSGTQLRFFLVVPGDTVDLYSGSVVGSELTLDTPATGPLGVHRYSFRRL